jgi:heat shock protein HtpX
MILVAVLTPLSVVLAFAAVVILLPRQFLFGLAVALCFGITGRMLAHGNRRQPPGKVLSERDDPELFTLLDRLCALADVGRPEVVLSNQRQPNSWVVHLPRQAPRLYVTTGLRELLTLEELGAVLGHEVSHIVNRDALVMSVVGLPGSVMLSARGGGFYGIIPLAIGTLSQIGTSTLSRYRELSADAGAASISGRPSALASALLKVSGSLDRMPTRDLRAAAAMNAFNLVAVTPARGHRASHNQLFGRITGTHPPLQVRLDALEKLERAQQLRRI